MSEQIRVIQYGLGPIGSAMARHVLERRGMELAGCVDVDPGKAGKDAGDAIELGRALGFSVAPTIGEALARKGADLVLHTTSSYFDQFKAQILELLGAGLDVVSTAEELSFPWVHDAGPALEIDAAAKRAGKTVLGTGVNPGFLMDLLPLGLTAICQKVDHISVRRIQNASKRRGPFQAKIGSGMTVGQFEEKMKEGRMGHVGLPQSIGMLFQTLGKQLVSYQSAVEPVVAERDVKTPFFEVPAGRVIGLKQVARGYGEEGEFVNLLFHAALDLDAEQDTILIQGKPSLEMSLKGTNGDLATIAIAVNAIRRVHDAPPGLLTMRDLPIVTSW